MIDFKLNATKINSLTIKTIMAIQFDISHLCDLLFLFCQQSTALVQQTSSKHSNCMKKNP